MAVVGLALSLVHLQVLQLLAGFLQAGSLGVFFDMAILEIVNPFLERRLGHLIKLIDADDEVFREDFLGRLYLDETLVARGDFQCVLGMDAHERRLAVV